MAQLLLVDDDPAILHLTSRLLAGAGHSVLLALGGLASIEVFDRHQEQIHAVLMDLRMPGLDGVTAFRQIRERRPDVPFVFVTGSAESLPEVVREEPGVAVLAKPYRLDDLVATVAQVLGPASASIVPSETDPVWHQLNLPATVPEPPSQGEP